MKKVLTAMVLGAAIIGGSAVAMAANSDAKSFDVKVTVAKYTDVTVPGQLVLAIDGPTNKNVTGTVIVRSNFGVILTASATSFGVGYVDTLDKLVSFSVGDTSFKPGDSNIGITNSLTGKHTYGFEAKTNFSANDEWTKISEITSDQDIHSQITLTVAAQ